MTCRHCRHSIIKAVGSTSMAIGWEHADDEVEENADHRAEVATE